MTSLWGGFFLLLPDDEMRTNEKLVRLQAKARRKYGGRHQAMSAVNGV